VSLKHCPLTVAAEQNYIESIDAEIALAMKQLEDLKKRRNAAEALLYSNTAPSEWQVQEVWRAIEQKEAELHSVQTQILDLERTVENYEDLSEHQQEMKKLIAQRDEAQSLLEAQRAILSPIRRVPIEILSEIFLHTLHNRCSNEISPYPSPNNSPMLLSNICLSWRKLALDLPLLWSTLHITIDNTVCRPNPQLIPLWLQRSGSLPLSITFVDRRSPSEPPQLTQLEDLAQAHNSEGITAVSIFEQLAPSYARWHSLSLEYTEWRRPTGLSFITKDSSPLNLQTLTVSRDFWLSEDVDSLTALMAAPQLTSLDWKCRHSRLDPIQVLPLAQMVNLDLNHRFDLNSLLDLFNACPNLVSGNFYVIHLPEGLIPQLERQTRIPVLDHLRELKLSMDWDVARLMGALKVPSLTSFMLRKNNDIFTLGEHPIGRFWDQTAFIGMLQRSACRLTILDLADVDVSPQELLALLQMQNSSLEHLVLAGEHLQSYPVDDEVLKALTPGRDGCLCPKLEYIKMWGCVGSTDGLLADMVESRWMHSDDDTAVTRLKMALFIFNSAEQPTDWKRLQHVNEVRPGITLIKQ